MKRSENVSSLNDSMNLTINGWFNF